MVCGDGHIKPRQKGAEKKKAKYLSQRIKSAVKRPGQVIIQGLKIFYKQKRDQQHAGSSLHQNGDAALLYFSTYYIGPFRKSYRAENPGFFLQVGAEISSPQGSFQVAVLNCLSHPAEDRLEATPSK